MIEDPDQNIQMTVMNDRSQGGSAYKDGRIEFMILRRGSFNDDLGNPESMNEVDS